MSGDFVITEEIKQAEAKAWKMRLARVMTSHPIMQEIRAGEEPKFINDDSAAKLCAFDRSEAAEAALEAAFEVAE